MTGCGKFIGYEIVCGVNVLCASCVSAANLGAERNAYIARSLAEKITALKNDERILLETQQSLVDRCWIAEAECKALKKECDTCFIRKERDALRAAILQTIEENGHLADGENCTLIALKRAVGET
jgi:hypothetical protein